MKRIGLLSAALISSSLVGGSGLHASSAPRYGGTLRVELRAQNVNLDPRQWQPGTLESATNEKLAALVFERLVALDDSGRFQPVLATDWSHDASYRHWQFVIRSGIKFSDGAPLTATDVAVALQPLALESLQISAAGNAVVIQSASPAPDLLAQLASGRYFVYRVSPGGVLVGTAPFVEDNPANETTSSVSHGHLLFRANEDAWSGRPFLDAIEVTLGVPALRAMFDLQVGKADLIELAPEVVPRAIQANLRIWTSDPVTLYGVRFDQTAGAATDPNLREALSLSLDREAMANVLLQKQAEPASALCRSGSRDMLSFSAWRPAWIVQRNCAVRFRQTP